MKIKLRDCIRVENKDSLATRIYCFELFSLLYSLFDAL
jgi:hypothetical protein